MGDNSRMSTKRVADHQWQKLYAFLQGLPRAYAGQEEKCRRFVEAVHWILRTGAQWRELPEPLWQVEQRLQALRTLGREQCLG